jgi:hypothetical protein
MTATSRTRWVILRDLMIFQVKLLLDGLKDVVLMPLSIAAAALDLFFPGPRPGHRFYGVMRVGEKYDNWLSLFSAADKADARADGLFGASRAGSASLLGRIEAAVIGHDEPIVEPRSARAASRASLPAPRGSPARLSTGVAIRRRPGRQRARRPLAGGRGGNRRAHVSLPRRSC